MQSKRMSQIKRRAKRRMIALAIVAAIVAGYSSRSLFAVEEPAGSSSISKIISKPGIKAVGIRMIHPSGDSQTSVNSSAQYAPSSSMPSLPMPSLPMPSLPMPMMLPPSNSPTNSALPQPPSQLPSQLPPAPNDSSTVGPAATGFSLLPAPPRMPEVATKNATGKVVMKLSGGNSSVNGNTSNTSNNGNEGAGTPAKLPMQTHAIDVTESLGGEVVPSRPLGQPAKMPPFLFEKSTPKVAAVTSQSGSNSVQSAVRISIADGRSDASAVSTHDQNASALTPPSNRTPQLVKSKPTQLGHTVVLAQSTDFEEPATNDQPDEFVPQVEVDATLVPNAISKGTVASIHGSGLNAKSGSVSKAVVADTVDDAFISFVSPAVERDSNGRKAGESKIAARSPEIDLDVVDYKSTIDNSRRRFDARLAGQAPNASIDLECLSATSMDLAGKLTAVAVQDESVCKVLHNGRTVSLVGNQEGTTLVQLWTSELGDKPQILRVNVSQQKGKVQATRNEVKDIKQVIAQGFPRADVNLISNEDGSIEVRGTTESEESAKRILDLVRKLYLVPVKDKLTVVN